MKKNILILAILLCANQVFAGEINPFKYLRMRVHANNAVPPDTTLTYLMALNIESYKNRPVDSFLLVLPANYLIKKVYGRGRPKYADVLIVTYPNGVAVHVVVRRFTHMNQRSNTLQWDINLFKLENIDHIEIHAGPVCVKGCF